MTKILNNYRKSMRIHGYAKGKIGYPLPIYDKNNQQLTVGDHIQYSGYDGILLYEPERKGYGVALGYSMWYGDNKYDVHSYGKFIDIPMDNGAKMELLKIE